VGLIPALQGAGFTAQGTEAQQLLDQIPAV
jgi:hypothetical protein